MKLNSKRVFVIIVIIIIIAIIFWPDYDTFIIKSIENGQTLVLNNGSKVKLIGVSDTQEGMSELMSLKGEEIILQPDGCARFDSHLLGHNDVVYSYVLLVRNHNECVNATLLKKGLADLQEDTYLTDSIISFRKYASFGNKKRKVNPTPNPVSVIDYEDDDIVLPTPPSPDYKRTRKHSCWYCDGTQNLDMLDEACDYTCPYTKQFANSLAKKSPGNFNIGQH